ncbi:uncharacterized protein PFL1_04197 [Pseudozyma flocculosa PF-1]|uniref:Related to O-methyltransferase n=2 Tax=Pseudozyma flocculosa TaxID=84751 RepID=A0A5C3ET52_9BASI|nr:uncharacterized protein PFL1_04197 [Pseudozyma flocculosa PF-1]EPQ28370.1 hypothetical protein PFL1_04197 [Pseudozyma flocculosa PF-1]SPO35524.1 related to O-methyltransferase [Pseudozyma flocculosa]
MSDGIPAETPLLSASKLLASILSSSSEGQPLSSSSLAKLKLAHKLLSNLDPYLDEVSSKAPEIQKPLLKATAENDWEGAWKRGETMFQLTPAWSAGAYEGNFVGMMTRIMNAKNALEVGMFTGTTTVCIASSLPKDGKVIALEIDPYLANFVKPHFDASGHGDKIDVRVGGAAESLVKIGEEGHQFEIIFIDADKPGYLSYYKTIMEKNLLKKGGLLVVDNTLYKGSPFAPEIVDFDDEISKPNADAITEFNKVVAADERVEVVLLPLRDGVTFIMNKE